MAPGGGDVPAQASSRSMRRQRGSPNQHGAPAETQASTSTGGRLSRLTSVCRRRIINQPSANVNGRGEGLTWRRQYRVKNRAMPPRIKGYLGRTGAQPRRQYKSAPVCGAIDVKRQIIAACRCHHGPANWRQDGEADATAGIAPRKRMPAWAAAGIFAEAGSSRKRRRSARSATRRR